MKMLMIKIIMVISTMITCLKTPMSMGIMLLIQTITSTMIMNKIMLSSWMSMIMFLMFVGSLLVLFLYMSSIASNEKFKPNMKMGAMMIILFIPMEELLSEFQINDFLVNFKTQEMISSIKIYNEKTLMITMLMFMYMFLTMIVVNFIIKIYKGPLRSKYE